MRIDIEDFVTPIFPMGIIMIWLSMGVGYSYLPWANNIINNYFFETSGLLYALFFGITALIKYNTYKD